MATSPFTGKYKARYCTLDGRLALRPALRKIVGKHTDLVIIPEMIQYLDFISQTSFPHAVGEAFSAGTAVIIDAVQNYSLSSPKS